ncbi:MAG: hypothetical protein AAF385_10225 [Pseudomonadota bacterium]
MTELPESVRSIPGFSDDTPVQVLPGGLSNLSWRITLDENDYAVRKGSQRSGDIQREVEIWQIAAANGLAPDLYYVDSDNGLIVSHWVYGLLLHQ